MKKHRLYFYICIFLIFAVCLCSLSSCSFSKYTVYCIGDKTYFVYEEPEYYYDDNAEQKKSLTIGNTVIELEYEQSVDYDWKETQRYNYFGLNEYLEMNVNSEMINNCYMTSQFSEGIPSQGIHLWDLAAQPSDDEIKTIAMTALEKHVDFSKYNHLEFSRSTNKYTGIETVEMRWVEIRGELETTNYVKLYIYDGILHTIKIENSCQEGITGDFITDEEKLELLNKGLRRHYKVWNPSKMSVLEVKEEVLTTYGNKEALIINIEHTFYAKSDFLCNCMPIWIINNDS